MRTLRAVLFASCCVLGVGVAAMPVLRAQRHAVAQDRHVTADRNATADQKIDQRLMREIYRRRGDARARNMPAGPTGVQIDRHGRAYIDVRAKVNAPLQKKITALGGRIVTTIPEYESIVAWMPLLTIERLAGDAGVRAIQPGT